jgi:hypothetical protein
MPQVRSEAGEGCRAEARRAKADRCGERWLGKSTIAGKTDVGPLPIKISKTTPCKVEMTVACKYAVDAEDI